MAHHFQRPYLLASLFVVGSNTNVLLKLFGQDRALTGAEMIYYSFVTLTTLGYGDIVPVSPSARSLATLEALTGQLYLTVLVARLVGLQITHSARRRSEDQEES